MIRFLRGKISPYLNSTGLLPQPIVLEKSLPVPIGRHPNCSWSKLSPALKHSSIPHIIVPSPPQIIILTSLILSVWSCFAFLSSLSFLFWSKRSISLTWIILSFLYSKQNSCFFSSRYRLPQPPPLLVLMRRRNQTCGIVGFYISVCIYKKLALQFIYKGEY